MNNRWIKSDNVTKTFRLNGEPELIHVIKTGFNDKYMVVYEDAYELHLGNVTFGTKIEIETKFNINLNSTEEEVICPKCGNDENFHFNYDYGKKELSIIDILCNECGEFFTIKNNKYND